MKNHRRPILRLIIFSLTLLSFARLSTCNFTWWDDQYTIHGNPRLNPPTLSTLGFYWNPANAGENTTMGLYVPVTYTVWSGLALLAHHDRPDADGLTLSPMVFHCANILIHAAAALIVFQLLLRLLGNDVPAAMGALLFALHPVQVESVGWISGTKDLLCGLLSTLALLFYVRSFQTESSDPHQRWPSRWRYLLGLFFFLLGMLAKPTAVVVPLMAIVISIFLLGRPAAKTIRSLLPWLLLMIPCLIWTKIVQPASLASPLPIWTRPAVAADALAFYLCKLACPIHLCILYGHNPPFIVASHLIYFSWILPALVIGVLWHTRKSLKTPVAAALLFLMPLLPVLGFVPFEFQRISTTADHYLYLPMLGVGLLFGFAIERWRIPFWIGALLLAALGIRSVLQEANWQDTRSLFYHVLTINPDSVEAFDGLGFITGRDARRLAGTGQSAQADALFEQSIHWYQKSLVYDSDSIPSLLNLALDYKAIGRVDLGLQQIHRMVAVQRHIPDGLRSDPLALARLLADFGDPRGAIALLDRVLAGDPANFQAALAREQLIDHLAKPVTTQQHGADANGP
jgi:hypothetical protein